ncbi:winged helix-turn-helix transcriptional regulator [Mucilaginibacter sp. HD30]
MQTTGIVVRSYKLRTAGRRYTEEKVERLHKQGVSFRNIAEQTAVSLATVFRMVKRLEKSERAVKTIG